MGAISAFDLGSTALCQSYLFTYKSGGPRGSITKGFLPESSRKGERRVDFLSSESDRITPAACVSQRGAHARSREDVPHA